MAAGAEGWVVEVCLDGVKEVRRDQSGLQNKAGTLGEQAQGRRPENRARH